MCVCVFVLVQQQGRVINYQQGAIIVPQHTHTHLHTHTFTHTHVHTHTITHTNTQTQGVVTPFDALHGFERRATRVRMGTNGHTFHQHTRTRVGSAGGGGGGGAGSAGAGSAGGHDEHDGYDAGPGRLPHAVMENHNDDVQGVQDAQDHQGEQGVAQAGVAEDEGVEEDAFSRAARKFRNIEAEKHRAKLLDVTEVRCMKCRCVWEGVIGWGEVIGCDWVCVIIWLCVLSTVCM